MKKVMSSRAIEKVKELHKYMIREHKYSIVQADAFIVTHIIAKDINDWIEWMDSTTILEKKINSMGERI